MLHLGASLQPDWHRVYVYAGARHPAFAAHYALKGKCLLCMLECHTCSGEAWHSSAAEMYLPYHELYIVSVLPVMLLMLLVRWALPACLTQLSDPLDVRAKREQIRGSFMPAS